MQKLTFNRIKELLARYKKQNTDLAEFMGVDPRVVSSWCTNKNQPEYSTLFKISDFFGIEAGDLLTLKKDLKPVKEEKQNTKRKVNGKAATKKK